MLLEKNRKVCMMEARAKCQSVVVLMILVVSVVLVVSSKLKLKYQSAKVQKETQFKYVKKSKYELNGQNAS